MTETLMRQQAPYPHILAELVTQLRYRPGWRFELTHMDRHQGSEGLTLDIITCGYNAYHPDRGQSYRVHHYMPVPPAAYNRRSWLNWLFQQVLLVEGHECAEFFALEHDGELERPYAPAHGPGNDPYLRLDYGTAEDRRTSFRGELNPQ